MNKILVIGAGRSSGALIGYLLEQAAAYQWSVTVADADLGMAQKKIAGHATGTAAQLDVNDAEARIALVQKADVVISLLPAFMHPIVAKDCLAEGKHLVTASYVSPEMQALSEEAKAKGLAFMCEIGLDPGIDHMSAMQIIDDIHGKGGKITSFKSYCGGLIAPSSDDNPWHYKFSWAPRNVILAGQGTAMYRLEGQNKYIPYNRLFTQYELIDVPRMGAYEAYANRDSLGYQSHYGLEETPTLLRATLRARTYCDAWNAFVRLGLTDDTFVMPNSAELTYSGFLEAFLDGSNATLTARQRLAIFLGLPLTHDILDKMDWLGLFSDTKIPLAKATPAQILQYILESKWVLRPEDKDMVIMKHEFEYTLDGEPHTHHSTLVMEGENVEHTAMAKLVGLPLGIFVKLLMLGQVKERGVMIPIRKDIYEPVLHELESYGVVFY